MQELQSTENLTIEEAKLRIENNSDYFFNKDYPFVKKVADRYFFICKDGIVEADLKFDGDVQINIINEFRSNDTCLIHEEILIIQEEANKKIEAFTELLSILEAKS